MQCNYVVYTQCGINLFKKFTIFYLFWIYIYLKKEQQIEVLNLFMSEWNELYFINYQ